MRNRVHIGQVAYPATAVGLLLALVVSALATGHSTTPTPDPSGLVFQPVVGASPAPPGPTAASTPSTIFEADLARPIRPKPTVPAIAAAGGTTVKATPKPKPKPKPVVRKAAPKPRTVAKTASVPSVAYARSYARSRIGSTQFSCLDALWQKESGWNPRAYNRSSGAYGIPQALPGSKMGSVASDWRYNPVTQVKWGLGYIAGRYGTACAAWSHSQQTGWY
jgi:hypothetical protein